MKIKNYKKHYTEKERKERLEEFNKKRVLISRETKTNASIIWIFLKILEISGFFTITVGVYYFGKYMRDNGNIIAPTNWLNGIVIVMIGILIVAVVAFIGWGFILFLIWLAKINWRWALMLVENGEEKIAREKLEKQERLKKLEKKKTDFVYHHGYWIGDKVRLVDVSSFDEYKPFLNKTGKVLDISWAGIKVKGMETIDPSSNRFKPIKDRRTKAQLKAKHAEESMHNSGY
jgi:hypothetical protein